MSSLRTVLLAGCGAMLLARGVAAQETRRLAGVVDTLAALQRAAHDRRQAFDDSVSRSRASFDTVRNGPLTVLVTRGERDVAAAAARLALDNLAPLGDSLLRRLHGLQFVMRSLSMSARELSRPRAVWESPPPRQVRLALLDHNDIERNQIHESASRTDLLAFYMAEQARLRLAESLPPALARWAGGRGSAGPVRWDTTLSAEWAQVRLELVSSPSVVARQCFEGRAADCRHVLGFDSSDTPVRSYFDAEGRRAVVRRNGGVLYRREHARTEQCLAGTDAACVQLLEVGLVDLSIGSARHRAALLQLAIREGGPDAALRMFRGGGSLTDQLATIAGVSADSLTVLWLARVRNQRVASDTMSPGMAAASLGWLGLFGLLALRNRRWR